MILRARIAREMTRKTFLSEWQRRGILSEMIDVEVEAMEVEAEGPALGDLGLFGQGGGDGGPGAPGGGTGGQGAAGGMGVDGNMAGMAGAAA
jgi:hypothetical protein